MKSEAYEILPTPVERLLKKLGRDIRVARKKRRLTVAMMMERVGVSKVTYLKVEKGDPRVGIGIYGNGADGALGLGTPLADIADPADDDEGLALEEARLPESVYGRRAGPPVYESNDRGSHRGRRGYLVGHLHYNLEGARESAFFEYDASWLDSWGRLDFHPGPPLPCAGISSFTSVHTGTIPCSMEPLRDTEPDWGMGEAGHTARPCEEASGRADTQGSAIPSATESTGLSPCRG